jgi:hypothetical protein
MDLKGADMNRQFKQYHQYFEIDDLVALWGQYLHEI